MNLTKYLKPSCIRINLDASDKWEVIETLLSALGRERLLADMDQVRADVIAREQKMSTGMEQGLALPHAKSTGVREMAVALGIAPRGVDFDSLDGKPAQVIFLVVSRKDVMGPHIQCLAEIAAAYRDVRLREQLVAAVDPEAVWRLLTSG